MNKYYKCAACGFPASITDKGVDEMRDHLKTHAKDKKPIRDKAYAVVGYER